MAKKLTKTMDGVALFNKIRATLSLNFRDRVPEASQETLAQIGYMMTANTMQIYANEWLDALIMRIGMTLFNNKALRDKLARFRRGTLEYGDIIQEIGIEIIKAKTYRGPELYGPGEICEPNPWCKEKPDVRVQYHRRNRQEFYKQTIFRETLKKSFTAQAGVTTLVEAIVERIYSSARADEYLWSKEMFSGYLNPPTGTGMTLAPDQLQLLDAPITDDTSAKAWIQTLREGAELLSFNANNFNPERLTTYSDPSDMELFVRRGITPLIDVETMAGAFNPNYLQYGYEPVILDDFGSNEIVTISGNQYQPVAFLADKDMFRILDNLREFHSLFNPEGLYWNYWLHVWQTYTISYMKNCMVFLEPYTPTPGGRRNLIKLENDCLRISTQEITDPSDLTTGRIKAMSDNSISDNPI